MLDLIFKLSLNEKRNCVFILFLFSKKFITWNLTIYNLNDFKIPFISPNILIKVRRRIFHVAQYQEFQSFPTLLLGLILDRLALDVTLLIIGGQPYY